MPRVTRVQPITYVCQGKHCSRACGHSSLLRSLDKVSDVRRVRCQKICRGSVVGTPLSGTLQWFERIDSPKVSVAMKKAVVTGSRKKLGPLKKRRVKERSGRPPR
jgi:hypothetical protein